MAKKLFLRDDSHCFEKFGCRLLRSQTNDQVACTKLVKKPRVPWKSVLWRLSGSMIREKNNPMYFFRSKDYHFFLQNFCFEQPLRCYRNDLVTSPVIVRILLDPYILTLRFVTLDNGRKNTPNLSSLEVLPFISKNCVSNNTLDVTEMFLQLPP